MRVFLGGTCVGYDWRKDLIPKLKCDYFNPVVENWTDECYNQELFERANDDYVIYIITSGMEGIYSIAEVVDDSNKKPEKTIFCFFEDGFSKGMIKSLKATEKMIVSNGGNSFSSLDEIAFFLNSKL